MSLHRILDDRGIRITVGLLAIAGHVAFGVMAWYGDRFALVMLVVFASFWTFMAVVNGLHWRSTLTRWEHSLDSWKETQELGHDYARLLGEACSALETWDREQADDIIERAITIGRLRQMNFDERSGQ